MFGGIYVKIKQAWVTMTTDKFELKGKKCIIKRDPEFDFLITSLLRLAALLVTRFRLPGIPTVSGAS